MAKKRILVISDTHCGHKVGLTPPDWWYQWPTQNERQKKVCQVQRELWEYFDSTLQEIKAEGDITHVFHLGDIVDGKGHRSGGTEQRTTDRAEQAEMGAFVLDYIGAPHVVLLAGTAYHTGDDEDWDAEVIGKVENCYVDYAGQDWIDMNGTIFDLKHHIGNSSIPHGAFTPIAKDKMWNKMWHMEHEQQPDADILIRGHVHRYRSCTESGWEAMTCDALCGFGSKFGVRRCSGIVGIGMLVFDVEENGDYRKCVYQAKLAHQKVGARKL